MRNKLIAWALGYVALLAGFWPGLFLAGCYATDTSEWIKRPRRLWLAPLGALAYLVGASAIGLVGLRFFGWVGNPVGALTLALLARVPFMLLSEEALSIFVLNRWGNLASVLVFALVHVPTYWDGSAVSTLAHVILLQGFARVILNALYKRTGSLWGSWLAHCLIDIFALFL